ncbi:MAG: 30S ribosomal protein S13 [Candidatus Micrarchaeia archaeon]|jgi:small subunit ribosomal protein S13
MSNVKEANKQEAKQGREEAGIVRIAGRDINGNFKIVKALMQVKGVGSTMASAIANVAYTKFGIDPSTKIGVLPEEKIAEIESIMKNPTKFGIPEYLLNRRKDRETGENLHLIGSDLTVRVRQDIEYDMKIQSWRGFRHQYGQKVRGQRTRSTGRTGATVGVTKKAAEQAQKAAQQQGKKEEKKK